MKNIFFCLILCFAFCNQANSQTRELSQKSKQQLNSLPELKLPASHRNKSIPQIKNNAEEIFFRDMFQQAGMSCGQASSVGLGFTYEINCARNVAANSDTTKYPTHFVYNWESDAYYGVSYYHTFEVLRLVGTPNLFDYGGTIDYGGTTRWMTGYDLYYNAMKNRLHRAFKIDVRTEEGLLTLKHWMNDHLNGSPHGGVANFYNGVPSASYTLPTGTPDAGMYVVPNMSGGTSHAMTVVGYHDSICYDYNSDGQYTNDIDINNDGTIDMKDWEIGGVKIANTYSGGPSFANGGFIYVMYKTLAEGGFWNGLVYVQDVKPNYEPQLTAKAEITYNKRKRLKITAGISTNLSDTYPQHSIEFPIFDYQCSDQFMTGGTNEIDKTIEFGLDLSPLLNYISPGQNAKYFLIVTENDEDNIGEGSINNFSIIDYTGSTPEEIISTQSNVNINQNSKTILWVTHDSDFSPPEITTTNLPTAPLQAPYTASMTVTNGTDPYLWEWDPDFEIEETTSFLPTAGNSIGSGYVPVDLGFDFPFYDSVYSTIYVGESGLIAFNDNFSHYLPYNHDDHVVFSHSRCIAPFFNSEETSTITKTNGSGYVSFLFNNPNIDFAVSLYESGEIRFIYGNETLNAHHSYVCGVSKGDERTSQKFFFDNLTNIPEGHCKILTPHEYPEEFNLSEDGQVTGTPTQIYSGEFFHIKVTDNNGLSDKISLPIISNGLMIHTSVSTSDSDEIIEYSETISLDIIAENPMAYDYTNITTELQSSDPYITITNSSANLPDIPSGGSANISDAFEFNVSGSIPDQHEITLNYHTLTNEGEYNYPLILTAFAPNLQNNNIHISDGNDNLFSANETGQIHLSIINSGGADANNIVFTLSNENNSIILDNTEVQLTGLEPQIDSLITFNVHTQNTIQESETNQLHLYITADNGFTQELDFEVPVYTPDIIHISTLIPDENNGFFDENETSDIIFYLQNENLVSATNLSVTFTSSDPYITINNTSDFISEIEGQSQNHITSNLTIGNDIPEGYVGNMQINISADYGYETQIDIDIPIGLIFETFETGNIENFPWETNPPYEWEITDQETYQGYFALKSGDINNYQESTLKVDFDVTTDGEISFARKVSSQQYYDFLDFMIDNEVQMSWSGELDWEYVSFPVQQGYHEFQWRYRKDFGTSSGQDAAWIDSIVFPPVIDIPYEFAINTTEINKTMYPDTQDTDTIIISNLGGGLLHYSLWLELAENKKSTKSIIGSSITCNTDIYTSGDQVWNMTVTNGSVDSEWLKTIIIDFPGGIDIQGSTNFTGGSGGDITSNGAIGNNTQLIWTCDGWGNIHGGESATCDIFLEISEGLTSELIIPYEIIGDEYGSTPHSITGELSFTSSTNNWITLSPFVGEIGFSGDSLIFVNFDTHNMEPGYYNGNLTVFYGIGSIDIPIELHVLYPMSQGYQTDKETISIFPNPASNTINITSNNKEESTLTIMDINGRILYNEAFSMNTNITIPKNWGNGIYEILILSNKKTYQQKITIIR